MNVIVRDGRPSDTAYVTDVWVTQATRHLNMSMRGVKARCQAIMANAKLTVACLPDDQDAILGFAVVEAGRVHMLYVRSSARRLGVASAILKGTDNGR